jgi:hypothetical protein
MYFTFNNECPKLDIETIFVTDKMGNLLLDERNKSLFSETFQLEIPEIKNDIY